MAKRIKTTPFRHVTMRGKAFLYRRTVPPQVRGKILREDGSPRADWVHTWPAGTPIATVEREAFKYSHKYDGLILAAKGNVRQIEIADAEASAREWLAGDPDDLAHFLTLLTEAKAMGTLSRADQTMRQAVMGGGTHPGDSPLLSAALAQDIERYGSARDNYPVESTGTDFIKVISDRPITTITRQDAMAWIDSLRAKGYAPATLRKKVGNMRGLLNRAFLDLEYQGLNPFAKHRLKGNGSVTDRLPFNVAGLAAIDAHLANSKRLKPETKQVLRIMKGTGASPKEIGGLVLADVQLDDVEIPYMWVRLNSQRGIKAASRDRQIPLVGVALEAMTEAVSEAMARTSGESPDTAKLFAGFGGKTGQDAKLISKNINKAINAAGIPKGGRLSAYSYRHSFEEALRSANIPSHMTDRLMGHTIPGIAGRYGSPRARLSEARDAIEKALDHLGRVDDSIYSERERMK